MSHRASVGSLLCTLVLGFSARVVAQDVPKSAPSGTHGTGTVDPIGGKLYPPELIMSHQGELGIDERQRDAILKEIERAQAQFPRLQWQVQAAAEQLSSLL